MIVDNASLDPLSVNKLSCKEQVFIAPVIQEFQFQTEDIYYYITGISNNLFNQETT